MCVCVCIHTMEYYSEWKRWNLSFATTWIKFEGVLLSKLKQIEEDKYPLISLIYETEWANKAGKWALQSKQELTCRYREQSSLHEGKGTEGRVNCLKGMDIIMMNGNWNFAWECSVLYTEVKKRNVCTHETYMTLSQWMIYH